MERLVPRSLEVKVGSIEKLDDYEQPLVVNLEVKGSLGSSAGKRRVLLGDIFESNARPSFPNAKREIPVAFEYSRFNQDAVRVKFPATLKLESLPASDGTSFKNFAVYSVKTESTPTSFTYRRDFALGEIIYLVNEYPDLRSFYSKLENKDQESVVLTAAAKPSTAGN